MSKITHVELKQIPIFGNMHSIDVIVKTNDSEKPIKLFSYFPDEISFTQNELIGLTIPEAHSLRTKKDIAYLQN